MLMNRNEILPLTLALALAAVPVHAEDILFFQDFGTDNSGDDCYQEINCDAPTTPQAWTDTGGDNATGGPAETWERQYSWSASNSDGNYTGSNHEEVQSGGNTRQWENQNPGLFSLEGPIDAGYVEDSSNWNIHDGFDNPWIAGYRTERIGDGGEVDGTGEDGSGQTIPADNTNMRGNMLGHSDENYNQGEANYYQIDGITIGDDELYDTVLMFDFDSWISDYGIYTHHWQDSYGNWRSSSQYYAGKDADAFAVSVLSETTGMHELLGMDKALAGNDLVYTEQRCGQTALDSLTNQACSEGSIWGYDGHDQGSISVPMAGTAMFDLSGFHGQTISLRFSFASDNGLTYSSSSSIAEGINIDNIKVTQTCIAGNGCAPPDQEVPEPGTLTLALLGACAALRRKYYGRTC